MNSQSLTKLFAATMYRGNVQRFVVRCEITKGIGIHVIGLPDENVRTMLLRVVTAMQHLDYGLPGKKIVITCTPLTAGKNRQSRIMRHLLSNTDALDLAIILTILMESGKIARIEDTENYCFMGEIGLDAKIHAPFTGIKDPEDAASLIDWQLMDDFPTIVGWKSEPVGYTNKSWKGYAVLPEVIEAINSATI